MCTTRNRTANNIVPLAAPPLSCLMSMCSEREVRGPNAARSDRREDAESGRHEQKVEEVDRQPQNATVVKYLGQSMPQLRSHLI